MCRFTTNNLRVVYGNNLKGIYNFLDKREQPLNSVNDHNLKKPNLNKRY